jgi:hypothetical protein
LQTLPTQRVLLCALGRFSDVYSAPTWKHLGGELRELGADELDKSELLAVLISTGTKGSLACLAN